MGLADKINNYTPTSTGGRPCLFCRWVSTLPEEDAAALREAMESRKLADLALTRIVNEEGHPCSVNTIRRHRTRGCVNQEMFG
jgi:hypothetical protein